MLIKTLRNHQRIPYRNLLTGSACSGSIRLNQRKGCFAAFSSYNKHVGMFIFALCNNVFVSARLAGKNVTVRFID
jgi:hypothetical protein